MGARRAIAFGPRAAADGENGTGSGTFQAEKFAIDVTKTPIPRFDLLKFDQYLYIGVQYSRGCPFTCEFCDIIELYGRVRGPKQISRCSLSSTGSTSLATGAT